MASRVIKQDAVELLYSWGFTYEELYDLIESGALGPGRVITIDDVEILLLSLGKLSDEEPGIVSLPRWARRRRVHRCRD